MLRFIRNVSLSIQPPHPVARLESQGAPPVSRKLRAQNGTRSQSTQPRDFSQVAMRQFFYDNGVHLRRWVGGGVE